MLTRHDYYKRRSLWVEYRMACWRIESGHGIATDIRATNSGDVHRLIESQVALINPVTHPLP